MSSPQSLAHAPLDRPVDLVSLDVAALAAHMRHCAQAQGRWFVFGSRLQHVRSIAAGRIVTLACLLAVSGAALLALA